MSATNVDNMGYTPYFAARSNNCWGGYHPNFSEVPCFVPGTLTWNPMGGLTSRWVSYSMPFRGERRTQV